ncbi:MAG: DUF2272 domain-containing protein [Lachnospiraceae bacterium]|nr:DUF2272 domain-containing protein [Lachnospiraceae bacterium]
MGEGPDKAYLDYGDEEGSGIEWSLSDDGTLTLSGTGASKDYNSYDDALKSPWNKHKTKVKKLIVNNGVTRIGNRAFQMFSDLETVRLPDSVQSVGDYAFQKCTKLTSVVAPAGITLGSGAFDGTPVGEEVNADISAIENDLYKGSEYYKNLCEVTLTGNYRDDVIAIAKSQIGYHEGNSEADYGGDNTSGNGDYTEYGRYLGSSGNAWCSEFATWCVRMAGLPTSKLNNSRGANANTFTKDTSARYYDWSQTTWGGGTYTPQKGDIILWVWSSSENYSTYTYSTSLSHTTIIESVDSNGSDVTFHVVHGNANGDVGEKDYTVSKTNGEYGTSGKIGYIVAPDYSNGTRQTVTFNADGGTVTPTSKKVEKGGLYGPMPVPTKSGNDFKGWYTSDNKKINIYTPCTLTSGQTLKAKWEAGEPDPDDNSVKPPVEYLRAGADESSITVYDKKMAPKKLGEDVYGQLYSYKAGGRSYVALYIYAKEGGTIIKTDDRIRRSSEPYAQGDNKGQG